LTCRQEKRKGKRKQTAMPLVRVRMALIVVGVLLWLVNSFIPIAGSIKQS
jgi:hypothetical protein